MTPPKITRNPNRGKHHAARLAQPSGRRERSKPSTRYMPGKTVAARIAGIQAYYERQARYAALERALS